MKKTPAFSLLEIAIVLLIIGTMMATVMPIVTRFHKTIEAKTHIEIALKSLGAYVAMHHVLPVPDAIHTNGNIIRGALPYQRLGLFKKGPMIQYAVDKILTITSTTYNFCSDHPNHFGGNTLEKDLVALELSIDHHKVQISRNNFYAQYCGGVCVSQTKSKITMPAVELD